MMLTFPCKPIYNISNDAHIDYERGQSKGRVGSKGERRDCDEGERRREAVDEGTRPGIFTTYIQNTKQLRLNLFLTFWRYF